MALQHQLGFLLVIATGLVIIDRYVRLQPLLGRGMGVSEGFRSGPLINGTLSRLGKRCGTDIGGCGDNRCANGFCISQAAPALVDKYPLPVLP
jgi:hypothetical protein